MAQPGDRRGAAFAVIVVIIAAVGIYLMWADWEDPPEQQPQAAPPTRVAIVTPTPLATASNAPFDVYDYLPMRKEQLAAAADLAERFTAVYGTFRYDEDPADYAGRLKAYTTPELGALLTRTVTSAGAVEQNRADELVSQATAKLKEIRQVGKGSIIFVVTGNRQVTAKSGDKLLTEEYAVTVSESGSDWRIFDIMPADEGQDGDTG
ncbi:hypothetical protein Nocox_36815 [Nonomuraea coxensis DSM 45129]|uniref:Mce-associated membrane protein n=1 Tax=Nonomuraea coxensis DSM 45129 TaxID=1122611 RepID=A0ABX8UB61_9ACTN|nr:hypothetical protein [Nonomuraea coxensis]QYC44917.1 hypothetical protein Nocox_36815 [Nonomuraea coxensis DSM 45129]